MRASVRNQAAASTCQQMGAGRVIDHLAEIRAERGIVHESGRPLMYASSVEVMCEIRSAPVGRKSGRARHINQPNVVTTMAAKAGGPLGPERGGCGSHRNIVTATDSDSARIAHGAIVKPSVSPRLSAMIAEQSTPPPSGAGFDADSGISGEELIIRPPR